MQIRLTKTRGILAHDLAERVKRANNPKKAMQAMGAVVVSIAQRAFTQPSLRIKAWAPLKPATIKAKRKAGFGTQPLRNTGALAQSPRIVEVKKDRVTVGSDRKAGAHSLAAIHQKGARNGRIPARPFFPINDHGFPADFARDRILSAVKRSLDAELPRQPGA